jgi:hypothetical protein
MNEYIDQRIVDKINSLSRIEMAKLWRFTSPGHLYFRNDKPYYQIFKKRFDELGGFNSTISKAIGW